MIIIDIIKSISGSVSKAHKAKQDRDRRVDDAIDQVELWQKQDDGRFAFIERVREIQNNISNLQGKVDGIMGTIETIFLIVDRTLGRKQNTGCKTDRRKNR